MPFLSDKNVELLHGDCSTSALLRLLRVFRCAYDPWHCHAWSRLMSSESILLMSCSMSCDCLSVCSIGLVGLHWVLKLV
jgi:hypothetical protein